MRVIEVFDKDSNSWVEKPFENLRITDVFRIFDNGERYTDLTSGNNVWIATCNPYYDNDGNLTIDTLY